MRKLGPLDVDILRAVMGWGGPCASYVVRNRLLGNPYFPYGSTRFVLYRLKVLEEHGLVRRVPSSYKTMIVWSITDAGRVYCPVTLAKRGN